MEEMKSIAKVCKVGNSLVVTIPIQIVKLQDLKVNDYVETSFKLIRKEKEVEINKENGKELPSL